MQSVASEPKFRQTARTIVRLKLSSWRNVVFDFERKLTKHNTHYHTHQLANGSDNNKLKSKLEVSLIQISLCSHHPQHQHLARTKAVNCLYYLIVCAPHTLIYHHLHRLRLSRSPMFLVAGLRTNCDILHAKSKENF